MRRPTFCRFLLTSGWMCVWLGCGASQHSAEEREADGDGDTDGDTDVDYGGCDEFCENDCTWGWDDDVDGDQHMCAEDCDSEDPTIYLGAPDEVGDGIDQSCDGVDGVDGDGDGHASMESGGDDCDDSSATTSPGPARDWTIEDAGAAAFPGSSDSLATDAAGSAHVVLAAQSPTYSTRREAGWLTEAIPSDAGMWSPSIAISSAGDVVVAFASQGIVLATRSARGGWWTFEGVDEEGDAPRLFLDAQDQPHVVYRVGSGARVHARRLAGSWERSDGPSGVQPCDVLVDRDGRMLALAVDEAAGDLLVWSLVADQWSASVVAPAVGSVPACALAAGPEGMQAAWLVDRTTAEGGSSTEVSHATSTDGLWTVQPVATEDDACVDLSLAVETDGTVHVGVACLGSMRWHSSEDAQWRHDVLLARAPAWEAREPEVDLAVDTAGVPQLLYRDGQTWRWMRLAPNDGVDQNCDGRDE